MYAALIIGPSTAVSRWSSFFIRSEMYPRRQNVFFIQQEAPCCPPGHGYTYGSQSDSLTPPPPPLTFTLRVSYSLSLICQPDIRGHEAPHHQLTRIAGLFGHPHKDPERVYKLSRVKVCAPKTRAYKSRIKQK